jgi:hypothetical protein
MRAARAVRPVLVLALAVAGVATPAFAKAPKPVCQLVLDLQGDAHRRPVQAAPVTVFDSPGLDITSADVATGKRTVVVVVRVKTTDLTGDPYAPLGYAWSFQWKIGSVVYAVKRSRKLGTDGSAVYTDTYSNGGVTGELPAGSKTSMDGTSYTWVLPRAAVPSLKAKKQVLTNLEVISSVTGGGNTDAAGTPKTYVDLTPSCLKAA